MANWYGTSRSNAFRVKDLEAFKKALEPWEIEVAERGDGRVALFPTTEDGDFPGIRYGDPDEDGFETEKEFSFEEYVVPYLVAGEVAINICSGAEKLRYVTGYANAFHSDGRVVGICLDDIATLAAKTFGMDPKAINEPCY